MAIGAATLADMFEPCERGTMMGIYYRYLAFLASLILDFELLRL